MIAGIIAAAIALILIGMAVACARAPLGWQDERGWHAGEPDDGDHPRDEAV